MFNVTVTGLEPIARELPVEIQVTTDIHSGHLNSKQISLPPYAGGGPSSSSPITSPGRVCAEENAFNHQEKPVSGPARAQSRHHTTHPCGSTGYLAGWAGSDT